MLTNANKGTYLVKNWQKYANVIYERPLVHTAFDGMGTVSKTIGATYFFITFLTSL